MGRAYTVSIRVLVIASLIYAAFASWRPLDFREALLWEHLVRPPFGVALRAPDAWSGLFYAVMAERAIGLFRLSEFTLRIPSLLSGVFCAWVLWRTERALLAVAFAVATAGAWFALAQGHALSLAFSFAAAVWPGHAGPLLGLAIAADPMMAIPLAVVAAAYGRTWHAVERVAIPAVATAFVLLILPGSHAARVTRPTDARPAFVRERDRRNAARGGAFQPPTLPQK